MVPFVALWEGVKGCLAEDIGIISTKPFGFEFFSDASTRHSDTVLEAQTK
jgi:hypothetical protein